MLLPLFVVTIQAFAFDYPELSQDTTVDEEVRISLSISRQNLEQVVSMFAKAGKKTIILGKNSTQGQVSAFFEDVPFSKALQYLADSQQLCLVELDSGYLLIDRGEYMDSYAETVILPLKKASPSAVSQLITGGSGGAAGGRGGGGGSLLSVTSDGRNRSLILRGDPKKIREAKELAEKLDASLDKEIFPIRFASVTSVADSIGESLGVGESGGARDAGSGVGSIVVDSRTNSLIISDTPENLDLCRDLIAHLDVPVETRVFSTGKIDPQTIADQIRRGELGGKGGDAGKGRGASESNVQVVEGANQIIVTDTPERLEILAGIMDELNRNIATRVIQPFYAMPTELSAILKTSFPDLLISVDDRSNSLVVTAHKERLEQMQEIVNKLDSKATVEVEIEAKLMLVSVRSMKEIGMNLFGQDPGGLNETLANMTFNPNFLADGVKPVGSTLGNPIVGSLTNPLKTSQNYLESLQPNIMINAYIRALESDADTTLLSNPKMRTLAGQVASIFSGSREPYKEIVLQDTRSQENVEFVDVGVTFEVTPYVNPENQLTIQVMANFSTVREFREGVPVVDSRKAETTIDARDGETIFLGGLISELLVKNKSGIPGLRALPGLGVLFGSKRARSEETELVIVIVPRIVKRYEDFVADGIGKAVSEAYEGVHREFGEPAEGLAETE